MFKRIVHLYSELLLITVLLLNVSLNAQTINLSFENDDELRTIPSKKIGSPKYVDGNFGKALVISGKSACLKINNRDFLDSQKGSIEFYFEVPPDSDEKQRACVFDALGSPDYWDRFACSIKSNKNTTTCVAHVVGQKELKYKADTILKYSANFKPGSWHKYTMTWENITPGTNKACVRLYIDGIERARALNKVITMKRVPKYMLIGGQTNRGKIPNQSPLVIDNFKIFKKVLKPSEIGKSTQNLKEISLSPYIKIRPKGNKINIDGTINKQEWAKAQILTGFRDYRSKNGSIVPFQSKVWLTYDEKNLYLAWKCMFNGYRPEGKERERDSSLWLDDSIEVLLIPNNQKKIYHFIGNAFSSIFDEYLLDKNNRDKKWALKCEYKSNYTAKQWNGELKIPFASLNAQAPSVGTKWKINICRNSFLPKNLSMWAHSTESFFDADKMGVMEFASQGLVINNYNPPTASIIGNNYINFRIGNTNRKTSEFIISLTSDNKKFKINSSASGNRKYLDFREFDFLYDFPKTGKYNCKLAVVDGKTNQAVLVQNFPLEASSPLIVNFKKRFSKGYVDIHVDPINFKKQLPASGLISLCKEIDNTMLWKKTIPVVSGEFSVKIPVEKLRGGNYKLTAKLLGKDSSIITSQVFSLKLPVKPACIDSKAGKGGVVPPWTALKFKNNKIYCWNRIYSFDKSPLPKSIISNGKELLDGEMVFDYESSGIKHPLKASGLEFYDINDDKIKFRGKLTSANVKIDVDGRIEYDGALIYNFKIRPLKKFYCSGFRLVVPLKAESAKYWLNCSAEEFSQKKNQIPLEVGKSLQGPFQYMFGIGCNNRGLQWFCESDEGWMPYDRKNCISVTKHSKEKVLLSFNIKQNVKFVSAMNMKCGFLATPSRPLPKDRDFQKVYHYWPGGAYFANSSTEYTFDLKKVAESGVKVVALHEFWPKYYGGSEPLNPESLKKFVNKAHKLGLRVILYRSASGNLNEPAYKYYGELWNAIPIRDWRIANIRDNMSAQWRCSAAPGYADWMVGAAKELIEKYDIDGFYYDWGCGICRNHEHGCGYKWQQGKYKTPAKGTETEIIGIKFKDDNSFSDYRPIKPIIAHRNLWKRMYTLVKNMKGNDGIINAHCDFSGYMIYFDFVDSVWNAEDIACHKRFPWMPTPEQYRLFISKQHLGLPGENIYYGFVKMGPFKTPWQQFAVSMPYGEWYRPQALGAKSHISPKTLKPLTQIWNTLDKFDYKQSSWIPYWENNKFVSYNRNNDVFVSFWKKKNDVLMVVSNLSPKTRDVNILLKDGMPSKYAVDCLHDKNIKIDNKTLKLSVPSRMLRLIKISK